VCEIITNYLFIFRYIARSDGDQFIDSKRSSYISTKVFFITPTCTYQPKINVFVEKLHNHWLADECAKSLIIKEGNIHAHFNKGFKAGVYNPNNYNLSIASNSPICEIVIRKNAYNESYKY